MSDITANTDHWLVSFGDISVSRHWLAVPGHTVPLSGTTFEVADRTFVTTRTPTWAVVVAIVGFFLIFILSLLFLLVRENVVSGQIDVTVRNDAAGLNYSTPFRVLGDGDAADLHARVNYARQLVGAA